MKIGDLVRYGFAGACLGVLLRKLQYDSDDDLGASNWDGEPAWWIQYINDEGPTWSYEEELTLVKKGN